MKKRIILIIIFIVALISLILYYTYAIDISSNSTTGDADLTFDIDIKNPNTRTVTVDANKTKIFDINVSSSNDVTIKYGIAYSGTKPDTVRIAQLNSSKDPVSGNIASNTTKNITIVIENKSNTNYTYTLQVVAGFQNGGNLIAPNNYTLITDIYAMLPSKANDYVMSLSQGDTWSSGDSGVYATNSYDDNGVTKYHDYRYIGANVNNWVRFNDDDYRIIGVFDDNTTGVEGEYLVKLIAANPLASVTWGVTNTAPSYITYSTYNSNWETANANILLNEYFLNATDTSSTYNNCSYWMYIGSYTYYKTYDCNNVKWYGIKTSEIRNYIQPVTWYLKGLGDNRNSKQSYYTCERSDDVTITNCTSGNQGTYATKVENKYVGLMYVSDYMYASGYYSSSDNFNSDITLYYGDQNWLNNGSEWMITSSSLSGNRIYCAERGYPASNNTDSVYAIRPTFYLKSFIKIKTGTGFYDDPFIIE